MFGALFGLVVVGTFWGRAEREAIRRIHRGANEAWALVGNRDMNLEELRPFARKLRAIDSTGAPEDVRQALSNYVAAVDRHEAYLSATGIWDTNVAWKVGDRQKEFWEVMTKNRGWLP